MRFGCFDPRPRTEGDKRPSPSPLPPSGFDPRPRAEGDGSAPRPNDRRGRFDPRPRAEGDLDRRVEFATAPVSIHALVRRATKEITLPRVRFVVSIHALVRRATAPHLMHFAVWRNPAVGANLHPPPAKPSPAPLTFANMSVFSATCSKREPPGGCGHAYGSRHAPFRTKTASPGEASATTMVWCAGNRFHEGASGRAEFASREPPPFRPRRRAR